MMIVQEIMHVWGLESRFQLVAEWASW